MVPQTQSRQRRNSSKVNLLISLTFHSAIVLALFYFAAREGLLGKQLKKIAVEMVKEKPPEKPKEPEKPIEAPKVITQASPPVASIAAPPAVAPPVTALPSFVFEGGKAVQTSSDPVQLYKGLVEYALRSKWNRPTDLADNSFVAEVEVSVDRAGQLSNPGWKKGSGHTRWDDSVRQAIAATKTVNRPPPTNFPPRILVRFDVQEVAETLAP
jgi:outer membrane biosynthesis protein TonB